MHIEYQFIFYIEFLLKNIIFKLFLYLIIGFTLRNYVCERSMECKDLDGEDCTDCYSAVDPTSPSECLFCGE